MIEVLFWGAVLRFCQALLQASPTILVGLLVAGVFRRLLGYQGTRRLFGQGSNGALLLAWLIGMLLPVCSLGVIPILYQMRRAGVSGGTILAFALTAPLFNPISVLYGLTLSNPLVIITFCFCCLVIVTTIGLAWDRLFPDTAVREPEPAVVAQGIKRMLAVAVTAAEESAGRASLFMAVGLIGVAALSVILPFGSLQQAAEHHDPWAPGFMSLVAIAAYATPMTAMVQLASMFEHGNSVGAAFALLALGAGANLGSIAWMTACYGIRRTAVWFGILWGMVVLLAYGVDKPLYPHGVDPAGHTHAFDVYCCPFPSGESQALQRTWTQLTEGTAPWERQSLMLLAALAAAGTVLKRSGRGEALERWLQRQPEKPSRYDIVLPAPVLGAAALAVLIGLSVLGCYVYYPPPGEIFEELRIINTEIAASANSRDWDTTAHWIPIQQDWVRKLQVSMFLRGQEPTSDQRDTADRLLNRLEVLYDALEAGDADVVRRHAQAANQAYRDLRTAYQEFINP
jgi:uncharacterized protein